MWSDLSASHPGSSLGLSPWRWSNSISAAHLRVLPNQTHRGPVILCTFHTPSTNCSPVIKEKYFIYVYKKSMKTPNEKYCKVKQNCLWVCICSAEVDMPMKLSRGLCTPLVKVIHLEVVIVGEIPQRAASACISGKPELLALSLHLTLQGQKQLSFTHFG